MNPVPPVLGMSRSSRPPLLFPRLPRTTGSAAVTSTDVALTTFFRVFVVVVSSSGQVSVLCISCVEPREDSLSDRGRVMLYFLTVFIGCNRRVLGCVGLIIMSVGLVSWCVSLCKVEFYFWP